MFLDLQKVSVKDNFSAVSYVVIFCSNIINVDVAEFCHNGHVVGNYSLCSYFRVRWLQLSIFTPVCNDPFLKHLVCDEWVLRHSADLLSTLAVVLCQFLDFLITINDNKFDIILIVKYSCQSKIRSNSLAAFILSVANEPADELFTFDYRIRRQFKLIALIVCICFIGFTFNSESHVKHVLVIFCPYVGILSD